MRTSSAPQIHLEPLDRTEALWLAARRAPTPKAGAAR
ncbi:hypothetical protein EDD99_5659 [Streptomyces sp. 846.5]|nr:hypothetical protein EDD99_5659 [Streptomyces sp. 846.5]